MINRNRYENVVYISVILMGVIFAFIGYLFPGGFWQSIIINIASNLITVGVFSYFVIEKLLLTRESKNRDKIQQEIKVVLWDSKMNKKVPLPIEMRRGDFTRGEILGRIGMLPMKKPGTRFSIKFMGQQDFLSRINQVLADDRCSELLIPCDTQEIDQFHL
jgi:hypothetical protein